MGIKGLPRLIRDKYPDVSERLHISTLQGSVIPVDTSTFMYRYLYGARSNVIRKTQFTFREVTITSSSSSEDGEGSKEPQVVHRWNTISSAEVTRVWLGLFRGLVNRYRDYDIKLIFVLDGPPTEMKQAVKDDRKADKEDIRSKIKKLRHDQNKLEEYKKTLALSRSITPEMIDVLIAVLKELDCVVLRAEHEADRICGQLGNLDNVAGVLSTDHDILAHGCKVLLVPCSDGNEYVTKITLDTLLKQMELDQTQFVVFCILSGCDYFEGVKRVKHKDKLSFVKNLDPVTSENGRVGYKIPQSLKKFYQEFVRKDNFTTL